MKQWWLKIKEWWNNLALREKQAVAAAGIAISLFIVYQWIWTPLNAHVQRQREQITNNEKLLVWMQAADKQLAKSRSQTVHRNKVGSPVALLSYMQKTIAQSGLGPSLTQLKQASNETIEAHFQKVIFDKLIVLLSTTLREQAVSITQMSVIAETDPGIVNADIILKLE